ncbi:hypothetical protein [Streptomyces sp. NPDC001536]|uniref:hypothetical protein n=1 Tax=Streptomyces sp. NPDC001536 TaxID=3364583 RepID=UPI0036A92566
MRSVGPSAAHTDDRLYRLRKPDVPAMHLVSYFVVLDDIRGQSRASYDCRTRLWRARPL